MSRPKSSPYRTKVVRSASPIPPLRGPVVATLGNLDGVHCGHQALLAELRRAKAGGSSVVVTFYPHPGRVLGKMPEIPMLTPLRERVGILSTFEVDLFYLIHFTPVFSRLSAGTFIDDYLIARLGVEHLFVGPDARIGADREGDIDFIRRHMESRGRAVTVVPFVELGGERISSRRIRTVVSAGDMGAAAQLLGRPYRLVGTVIGGDRRGRTIGFPTANLTVGKRALPAHGVYAGWASLADRRYPVVVNIGVRPTFGGQRPTVEAHLLDYAGDDFYGARLSVDFATRLRSEMRFASVADLVAQIGADVVAAREYLERHGST